MGATIGISPAEIVLAAVGVPAFRVGTLGCLDGDDGSKYYVYGHAQEIITAAGYACVFNSGHEVEMIDATSSAPGSGVGAMVGAAMAALADNDWGWFQVYGKGSIRTLASAAVGTLLHSTATPGALDDAATAGLEPIIGLYLGTVSGGSAETNADAYFNYPSIGLTAA